MGHCCKAFANSELLSTKISMCMNWEGGGRVSFNDLVQRQRQTLTQMTFGPSYKPESFLLFPFSLEINK